MTLKEALRNAGVKARVKELEDALQISKVTANRKLNGHRPFLDYEIAALAFRYNWTPEEVFEIFFEKFRK